MIPNPDVQTLDVLRTASACINLGQHAQARDLLAPLIRAQPDCAEAHRLLGVSLCQTGEFSRAQSVLGKYLRLREDDADTLLLLCRVLSQTGQAAEALSTLRSAFERAPGNLRIACALARMLLAQSRAEDALKVLETALPDQGEAAPGEFWMLLGHARMLLARPAAAAEAFRTWVRLEPHNHDARLRLAAALADGENAVEAEVEVRHCMAAGANSADAAFILARSLMGQGRHDEAETQLRIVVKAQPDHVTAQRNLAELAWMRAGDVEAACVELDSALRKQPCLHALRIAKAQVLLGARQAPAALEEIEAGLAHESSAADLLSAAATVALEFDGPRALKFAKRACAVMPRDSGPIIALGKAFLATGDARPALDIAMKLQAAYPTDGQALALQADAMRMLGDERYRELLDYSRFVRAFALDTPRGWPDLDAYVADLQLALERAHVLKAHPVGNSLRHGSQIELLPERSSEPAIRAFPSAIDGPIRLYLEALGRGESIMQRRNTGYYRLSGMWSVRLRPQGFHVNHYHPEGWISSACYLHIPSAVEKAGGEGWLKFGEPAFPTTPALGPEYFLKPEPGLLALFPSYMWHGTVPFSGAGAESRLTIAFDVMPAGAE